MLRISNELASGVAGMPPPDSDVEPIVGNIMDQFIDVFMRPYRYKILECHGELFIRPAVTSATTIDATSIGYVTI